MQAPTDLFTAVQDNMFFIAMWAVLALFVSAIVVGALIVMRNHGKRRPFEGNLEFDLEKIAEEIDAEIANLRDLRNRLLPYKENEEPQAGEGITSAQNLEPGAGSATAANSDPAVVQEFQKRIAELEKKLSEAQSAAQNQTATAQSSNTESPATNTASSASGPDLNEARELQTKLNKQTEELQELKKAKDLLEKIVAEYQLFEDDFALVKKYKRENEELRKRLMDKEGLSAEQVDQLLEQNAAAAPSPTKTEPAPAPETAATAIEPKSEAEASAEAAETTPAPEAAPASADLEALAEAEVEVDQPAADDPQAAIDSLFEEAQAAANASAPAASTPSPTPTEDKTAPAAASGEDELMAEFEKLLSEKA